MGQTLVVKALWLSSSLSKKDRSNQSAHTTLVCPIFGISSMRRVRATDLLNWVLSLVAGS